VALDQQRGLELGERALAGVDPGHGGAGDALGHAVLHAERPAGGSGGEAAVGLAKHGRGIGVGHGWRLARDEASH